MQSSLTKKLLNIYFYFQCLFVLFNVYALIGLLGTCFIIFAIISSAYGVKIIHLLITLLILLIIISLFILYLYLTIVAAKTTKKIIKQKPISKFENIWGIIFPFIIILYIFGLTYNDCDGFYAIKKSVDDFFLMFS